MDHPYYKAISRKVGIRPQFAAEKQIIQRIKQAGLANLIQPIKKVTSEDFTSALLEGREMMQTRYVSKVELTNIVEATNVVFTSLGLNNHKLKPWSLDKAYERLHLNTAAGFPYEGKKGANLDQIKANTQKSYKQNLREWMKYPVFRSFRLSLRPEDYRNPNSKIKSSIRVIYPLSADITAFEEMFVAPAIDYFKENNTWYSTGKVGHQYKDQIKRRFMSCSNIIGTDVKKFDLTLHHYCYLAAFCALKECFVMNNKDSYLYNDIVKYIHCCVIGSKRPDGLKETFIKRRGMISGTTFTNLIDSLSNAIIVALKCPSVFRTGSVMICGDDIIMSLPKDIGDEDLFKVYAEFGMEVRKDASYKFKSWNKVFYLGYWWINGHKHLHHKLALNKCIFHSQFITELSEYDRVVARCSSILLNGKDGKDLFLKLFPDIKAQLQRGVDVKYHEILQYSPTFGKVENFGKFLPNQSLQKALDFGYLLR